MTFPPMRSIPGTGGVRKTTRRWLGSLVLVMALAALAGIIKTVAG